MKKLLLFLPVLGIGLLSQAQQPLRDNKMKMYMQDRAVVLQNSAGNHPAPSQPGNQGARAGVTILQSQRIGSAGNMLSILNGQCNQIDVIDSLNTVVFIHRNDPTLLTGSNVGQYRFDISKDRGATWNVDLGPITNDPNIGASVNGRFPQGGLFNPTGNQIADSAYLVYSGTWHDDVTWVGQMRGEGKLSGDTASFSTNIDVTNNRFNAIAGGFCQSVPGTFWNVNLDYSGTFNGGDAISTGLIVSKGVWNNNTKSVTWTDTKINIDFVEDNSSGSNVSLATSQLIAFDPTGQFGWIAILGDINDDADRVYEPIFLQSTNGGQTWGNPVQVNLEQIPGLVGELNELWANGTTASSLNPTTSFDSKLAVDANGNPHLLVTIGNGSDYSIEPAGYDMWDITYDGNAVQGCTWQGYHLADIRTFRGDFTNDAQPYSEDNRPLVSRTDDGEKIFFFWNESDFDFLQAPDNSIPNMFGIGIDVVNKKRTQVYNFTEGDTLWGGETINSGGGVFGGATFPTVSPTAWVKGNAYNIPLVLTQIDYAHNPAQGLGSGEQPAAFWYISNLDVPMADFTEELDQIAPVITLNGPDTVIINVGTGYTEQGATALDCTDGVITPTILNAPDTTTVNLYNVLYIATDNAGNSDTVTRVVIVGAKPVADFSWSFPSLSNRPQFLDQSINLPTSWLWTFGDGGGSTQQNPSRNYNAGGTYNVCLTATNSFGSSTQVCKQVTITVGINDPEFAQQLSLFPNPTNGKVAIQVAGDASTQMTVTVYNMLGEVVKQPVTYPAGTLQMNIDMSDANSGLYLVKIAGKNSTAIKQLTLNR